MGSEATPQTLAKLTPDPLWLLIQGGVINEVLVEAAFKIRRAYGFISAGTRMSLMDYERLCLPQDKDGGWNRAETTTDEPNCVKRYFSWCRKMQDRQEKIQPALDCIIDGVMPSSPVKFARALKLF